MKAIAIAVFLSRFCLVCSVFSEITFFGISWKPDEVCFGAYGGSCKDNGIAATVRLHTQIHLANASLHTRDNPYITPTDYTVVSIVLSIIP